MIARPFSQAVQWPGTVVQPEQKAEFEQFLTETFGVRGQFIGCFETLPDFEDGVAVADTGGRIDAYFVVHEDDIGKFAVPRFAYGMRWVDDVIANEKMRGEVSIYVPEVHELCSWGGGCAEDTVEEADPEYLEDGSETGCVGE